MMPELLEMLFVECLGHELEVRREFKGTRLAWTN